MACAEADDLDQRVAETIRLLTQRQQTVATAESITGGGICALLTSVPGASAAVRGGLVVYAPELKTTLAGVSEELLATRGTVHQQTALALACGARERCGAHWGLGVTGVAGPGPHEGLPSGTVYVALVGPSQRTCRSLHSAADRVGVRAEATAAAVALLWEYLRSAER